MSKNPWHPCDEGIIPIAEALEHLINAPVSDLLERLQYQSTQPSHKLAGIFTDPGMGSGTRSAGRREMTRRWLQFNGLEADSQEFDHRLQTILDKLREWERQALNSEPPEDNNLIFNRSICDAYEDVLDEAAGTADYLRQLVAMLRAKIKKTVKEGSGLADKLPDEEPSGGETQPKPNNGKRPMPENESNGTEEQEGEWSKPMPKAEMMTRVKLAPKAFKGFAKLHGLKNAGSRRLWQIRVDKMDANTRNRLEHGYPKQ